MSKKLKLRSGYEGEGPLRKFITPHTRKINADTREIDFIISTEGRDRDGDIIDSDGWELEHYLKNPIVLWAHDGGQPPIGKATSLSRAKGRLQATAKFASKETYPFADTVFRLYEGGFLNAVSVGFQPKELELIEGEDPGDFGFRFIRQELMEFSAVPIPANPEALVLARSAGHDITPFKQMIGRMLDTGEGDWATEKLHQTFITLFGKVHPVLQQAIAERNANAVRNRELLEVQGKDAILEGDSQDESAGEEDAGEEEAPIVATGPTDNEEAAEQHSHELEVGAAQTEPSEDDGHVHAVNYDEEGAAEVEEAEGHSHEVNATAEVPEEEDEIPEEETDSESEGSKVFTDWPQPGMDLPVSILTSEYRAFPIAEAKALKDGWPEIWELGDFPEMFDDLVAGKKNAILYREKWAAENVSGWELKDVVNQVQLLVRGARGIEHTRNIISLEKEKRVSNEVQVKKPVQVPQKLDTEEILNKVIEHGVVPALKRAISEHTGRVL